VQVTNITEPAATPATRAADVGVGPAGGGGATENIPVPFTHTQKKSSTSNRGWLQRWCCCCHISCWRNGDLELRVSVPIWYAK
jgi:hypothetical protein